jgi:hypothetical protein
MIDNILFYLPIIIIWTNLISFVGYFANNEIGHIINDNYIFNIRVKCYTATLVFTLCNMISSVMCFFLVLFF